MIAAMPRRKFTSTLALGCACLTAGLSLETRAQAPAQAPVAAAQRVAPNAGGPTWQSLTREQQSALAPLQSEWNGIDSARKSKWIDIARRYPQLPVDEQQRLHARMSDWARLSPSERARARLNYQETKQIAPQDRAAQWQAYQALPESQRKALAQRARPDAGRNGAGASAATAPTPYPTARPAPAEAKRNIVGNPSLAAKPPKAVAPTVVQAAPGATTTLVTRQPAPPAHQQAGLPKIAATPGFVDRSTLLPKRGPQGAATRSANNNAQTPPKTP
jgi:hypothetical protein